MLRERHAAGAIGSRSDRQEGVIGSGSGRQQERWAVGGIGSGRVRQLKRYAAEVSDR